MRLIALLAITSLFAAEQVPPEQINQELSQADRDLAQAQKMFNPWYTGPIVAGSASMLPPGVINVQPYLFLIDNHAAFDKNYHSVNTPNTWEFNPEFVLQTGITNWMDISCVPQFFTNNIHGLWSTHFGDLPFLLGFKITDESRYIPKMKITINEQFPTGNFQNLDPSNEGIDSTGTGSFITGFSFRAAKIFFWWTQHPLATRMVLTYNIPSMVNVTGYNTYGGGVGTSGRVHPGNFFNADLGLEWSLSQQWVIATDLVYQTNNHNTFSGTPGTDPATGLPNIVGNPPSQVLQVAPALEWNYNENIGVIAGVWLSVWGQNTPNFINYVLSVTYTFSVD